MKVLGLTSALILCLVLVTVHPAPLLDGGALEPGALAVPAGAGLAAGVGFNPVTGLALGGAGALTIPTYMLLLKGALLKKAALLGAGGAALTFGAGNRNNYNRPGQYYYS